MQKLGDLLSGLDDPFEIVRRLRNATNDPWYIQYAEAVAMKMVTNIFSDAGRTWRQAANKNSKGGVLYRALMQEFETSIGGAVMAQVRENAEYIRSVPADVAREMTEHIMHQSMAGFRASEIAEHLLSIYPHISEVKANLIARTETSKTRTALEQARSQRLGARWYQWRTSEDARVRKSHRLMDKVLVAWDDPPSPEELAGEKSVGHYHAGCIWNCRCAALTVLTLEDVDWPCKVYRNGSVTTMTRAQFERIWTPSLVG